MALDKFWNQVTKGSSHLAIKPVQHPERIARRRPSCLASDMVLGSPMDVTSKVRLGSM